MVIKSYKSKNFRYPKYLFLILLILILFSLPLFIYAHGEEDETKNTESLITKSALISIILAGIISGVVVILAISIKKKTKILKLFLFFGIIIPIILATLYSAGSTIYLNFISVTKGPIHWHADYEIWACGQMLELIDPTGISNRIGTPVFHEHNDNRIHVEGVVLNPEDVELGKFFKFVGGQLHKEHFMLPTNNGVVEKNNGDTCNGKNGKIQVFVYKTKNGRYTQEKIEDFEEYVLSPYPNIPPGDCIIIEFDEEKPKTEHICTTYRIAIQRGELSGS